MGARQSSGQSTDSIPTAAAANGVESDGRGTTNGGANTAVETSSSSANRTRFNSQAAASSSTTTSSASHRHHHHNHHPSHHHHHHHNHHLHRHNNNNNNTRPRPSRSRSITTTDQQIDTDAAALIAALRLQQRRRATNQLANGGAGASSATGAAAASSDQSSESDDDDEDEDGDNDLALSSSTVRSLDRLLRLNSATNSDNGQSSSTSRVWVPPISFRCFDIKCPICNKSIPFDDVDYHLVVCLTRPRIDYNEETLVEERGECVICFDEMSQGDTIARLPCLCVYHKTCIDRWFKVKNCCPAHPSDDD